MSPIQLLEGVDVTTFKSTGWPFPPMVKLSSTSDPGKTFQTGVSFLKSLLHACIKREDEGSYVDFVGLFICVSNAADNLGPLPTCVGIIDATDTPRLWLANLMHVALTELGITPENLQGARNAIALNWAIELKHTKINWPTDQPGLNLRLANCLLDYLLICRAPNAVSGDHNRRANELFRLLNLLETSTQQLIGKVEVRNGDFPETDPEWIGGAIWFWLFRQLLAGINPD
jgi:hypothetical protein